MINDEQVKNLLDQLCSFDEVEAVVLGGSRSGKNSDDRSDYDIYVYGEPFVPEEKRNAIYESLCSKYETGNHYFEYEDNVILKNGTYADIIFRNFTDIERYLHHVVDGGKAFNGYTTCFWHNVIRSEILYDKNRKYEAMQKKYDIPYPEKLRENIIKRNMALLRGYMPSYDKQVMKAAGRDDIVSVNHRTAAFLESYFDVIFAANKKTHPGEKKLIDICKSECEILPEGFEENLRTLFDVMFADKDKLRAALDEIIKELEAVLEKNNIVFGG